MIFAFVAVVAALLHHSPPERFPYPPCPIHVLTGLLCPGCGATRALAALTHGHLRTAMHSNALTTAMLPLLVLYLLQAWRAGRHWPPLPAPATVLLWSVTLAFTAVRNLPLAR